MSSVCVWNIKAATVASLIFHTANQAVLSGPEGRLLWSEREVRSSFWCVLYDWFHSLMQVWNDIGETKTYLIVELLFQCVRSWPPSLASSMSTCHRLSAGNILSSSYGFHNISPPAAWSITENASVTRHIFKSFRVTSCENHFPARGQWFHVSSIFLLYHIKDVISFFPYWRK